MEETDITKTGPKGLKGVDKTHGYTLPNGMVVTADELSTEGMKRTRDRINQSRIDSITGRDSSEVATDPSNFEIFEVRTPGVSNYGESKYDEGLLFNPTARDVQDNRSYNQPWLAKVGAGIGKGVVLTATTAAHSYGWVAAGIIGAISQGKWSGFWDNSFTRTLNDINEWSEELMPNYMSYEEQVKPFTFGANFIGDKIIKNLGFVAGAYLGGKGISTAVSKGLSAIGKISPKLAFLGSQTSQIPKHITIGAASGIGALSEGSIEALNNTKEARKGAEFDINNDYQQHLYKAAQQYGENSEEFRAEQVRLDQIRKESFAKLDEDMDKMGNAILLGNLPILLASNLLQFGKAWSRGFKPLREASLDLKTTSEKALRKAGQEVVETTAESASKGLIKRGSRMSIKGASKQVLDEATDLIQKGSAELVSKKTAFKGVLRGLTNPLSEGSEEMLQGMVSDAAGNYYLADVMNYYKAKKDPNAEIKVVTASDAIRKSIVDNIQDGFAWEEFAIGAFTGALGMPSFRKSKAADGTRQSPIKMEGGIYGGFRDYMEGKAKEDALADRVNKSLRNPELVAKYRNLIAQEKFLTDQQDAINENNERKYKDSEHASFIADVAMHKNAGTLDLLRNIIENSTETTEEGLASLIDATSVKGQNALGEEVLVSGPYIKNGVPLNQTEEGRQEMISKLQERKEKLLNTIDTYSKAHSEVNNLTNGNLSDDQLEVLSYMYTQNKDWEGRLDEMFHTISPSLQKLLDKEYSVKDNLSTLKRDAENNIATEESTLDNMREEGRSQQDIQEQEKKIENAKAVLKNVDTTIANNNDALEAYTKIREAKTGREAADLLRGNNALLQHIKETLITSEDFNEQSVNDINTIKDMALVSENLLEFEKTKAAYLMNPDKLLADMTDSEVQLLNDFASKTTEEILRRLEDVSDLNSFRLLMNQINNKELVPLILTNLKNNTNSTISKLAVEYEKLIEFSDIIEQILNKHLRKYKERLRRKEEINKEIQKILKGEFGQQLEEKLNEKRSLEEEINELKYELSEIEYEINSQLAPSSMFDYTQEDPNDEFLNSKEYKKYTKRREKILKSLQPLEEELQQLNYDIFSIKLEIEEYRGKAEEELTKYRETLSEEDQKIFDNIVNNGIDYNDESEIDKQFRLIEYESLNKLIYSGKVVSDNEVIYDGNTVESIIKFYKKYGLLTPDSLVAEYMKVVGIKKATESKPDNRAPKKPNKPKPTNNTPSNRISLDEAGEITANEVVERDEQLELPLVEEKLNEASQEQLEELMGSKEKVEEFLKETLQLENPTKEDISDIESIASIIYSNNILPPVHNGSTESNSEENNNDTSSSPSLRSWVETKYDINELKDKNTRRKVRRNLPIVDALDELGAYDIVDNGSLGRVYNRYPDTPIHYIRSADGRLAGTTLLAIELTPEVLAVMNPTNTITTQDGKSYQVVGALGYNGKNSSSISSYNDINNQVNSEYNNYVSQNKEESPTFYRASFTNKIKHIYSGRMVKSTEEQSPRQRNINEVLPQNQMHLVFYYDSSNSSTPTLSNDANIVKINNFNSNHREGSVYLLTQEADGKYYSKAVRVKRLNNTEYSKTENANTPIMKSIRDLIKIIVDPNKPVLKRSAAKYKLMELLYFPEGSQIIFNKDSVSINGVKDNIASGEDIEAKAEAVLDVLYSMNLRFQISPTGLKDKTYLTSIYQSNILTTDIIQPNNINASFEVYNQVFTEEGPKLIEDSPIEERNNTEKVTIQNTSTSKKIMLENVTYTLQEDGTVVDADNTAVSADKTDLVKFTNQILEGLIEPVHGNTNLYITTLSSGEQVGMLNRKVVKGTQLEDLLKMAEKAYKKANRGKNARKSINKVEEILQEVPQEPFNDTPSQPNQVEGPSTQEDSVDEYYSDHTTPVESTINETKPIEKVSKRKKRDTTNKAVTGIDLTLNNISKEDTSDHAQENFDKYIKKKIYKGAIRELGFSNIKEFVEYVNDPKNKIDQILEVKNEEEFKEMLEIIKKCRL